VVAAFEALLAGADEDYRLARGDSFQLASADVNLTNLPPAVSMSA
jgi:hypothetical protein